ELGAEPAAHELGDDPDLALIQVKDAGQLVADAAGALGGGVDGQAVRLPVGDDAVRLQGAVGLDLGAVGGLDGHVGIAQGLVDLVAVHAAGRKDRGAADVALLGDAAGAAAAAGGAGLLGLAGEDDRGVVLLRPLQV